jgi:hypothetical protein
MDNMTKTRDTAVLYQQWKTSLVKVLGRHSRRNIIHKSNVNDTMTQKALTNRNHAHLILLCKAHKL